MALAVVVAAGAGVMLATESYEMLLGGRFIAGIGVGGL
jgi:hypothetical protein